MGCNMANKEVSLVKVVSGVGAETRTGVNELQDLVDVVAEETQNALREIMLALAQTAQALDEQVAKAADIAVPADFEQRKREAISLFRSEADRLRLLANGVWNSKSTSELRDEIKAALLVMIDERADNIAAAYAGRVLPEVR